jgi:hypothetical protein
MINRKCEEERENLGYSSKRENGFVGKSSTSAFPRVDGCPFSSVLFLDAEKSL